jgi:amino acid transporter
VVCVCVVVWCAVIDCIRKLLVICFPVFFDPAGSASQLIFGLMVCFLTFGTYVSLSPYADEADDTLAKISQVQIFFTLLSAIALTFQKLAPDDNSSLDVLLIVCLVIPFACALLMETPLHKLFLQEERRQMFASAVEKFKGRVQPLPPPGKTTV